MPTWPSTRAWRRPLKTDVPGVDWLLACEPRPAQLEALARSYTGIAYRDDRNAEPRARPLPHSGRPARGWGHFLEMRVGKTPALLNEAQLFRRDAGFHRCLVLSPNQYKHTWESEAVRFGVDVPMHVFESSKAKEFTKFLARTTQSMVFVNYEALIPDAHYALLSGYVDDRTLLAADESAMLKNRDSKSFKRAHELAKAAGAVRLLSGKPAPQGVQDLYSQLRMIGGLDGWNFYQFKNTFAEIGGFKGREIIGVKNEDRLARIRLALSFFARRAEWGTSITSDYEIVTLEMEARQRAAYASMEEDFLVWLEEGDAITADQVVTKLLKLQQIASGFIYGADKEPRWLLPFDKTPKCDDMLFKLGHQVTGKTIVVYHHGPVGDELTRVLAPYRPALIRSQQHMAKMKLDVNSEKARFNGDPSCRVLIGQSKALKYGHTLMGQPGDRCATTMYFENSYSLDDRSQTEERNQGEGQESAIHIVDWCSSAIEARIASALQRKEDVAARIMGYSAEIRRNNTLTTI